MYDPETSTLELGLVRDPRRGRPDGDRVRQVQRTTRSRTRGLAPAPLTQRVAVDRREQARVCDLFSRLHVPVHPALRIEVRL